MSFLYDAGELDEQLGLALQKARATYDMDQSKLVFLVNERGLRWNQSTLSKIESGKRPLRLSEATVLSEVLGMSLEELAFGSDAPTGNVRSIRDRELDALEQFLKSRRELNGRGVEA